MKRFTDSRAEAIYLRKPVASLPRNVVRHALPILGMLVAAAEFRDVEFFSGSPLRLGSRWAVQIFDKWHATFDWEEGRAVSIKLQRLRL